MKKFVFVGQTPPPLYGQAIMIEKILKGNYSTIELFHVRMAFSKDIDNIGSASFTKVIHLFQVIAQIWYYRIVKGANNLYYPPAGPDKVPIVRDIVILLATRWMFGKTIFHFHAGGVSEYKSKSNLFNMLFKLAYNRADTAIILSELNPSDGKNLNAKNEVVLPYGIEDNGKNSIDTRKQNDRVTILFVAVIKETKGINVLLNAIRILKEKNFDFVLKVMGKFESEEFEIQIKNLIEDFDLGNYVVFLGVLSGTAKLDEFKNADIFCFPTFYESETFGVVLLEAMQFSLPTIATNWRGVPSVVENNKTGLIVDPKNAEQLSEALEKLISNKELRQELGRNGRVKFLESYTIDIFYKKIEEVFSKC